MSTPSKHRYDVSEIVATFSLKPFFAPVDEDEAALSLVALAEECMSVSELVRKSVDAGLFGHFRRSSYLYVSIVRENQRSVKSE